MAGIMSNSVKVTADTPGYTTGNNYEYRGACWSHDYTQLDYHAVNDNNVLSVIPIENGEFV